MNDRFKAISNGIKKHFKDCTGIELVSDTEAKTDVKITFKDEKQYILMLFHRVEVAYLYQLVTDYLFVQHYKNNQTGHDLKIQRIGSNTNIFKFNMNFEFDSDMIFHKFEDGTEYEYGNEVIE